MRPFDSGSKVVTVSYTHLVEAMDLVDEQDIALLEVREDGRQIARALDGGAARRLDVRAQLVGDDRGQRGLAEARRS